MPQKYIGHVQTVLTILRSVGVTLKLKSRFFAKTIHFSEHVVRPRRFELLSQTIDAIHGLKSRLNSTTFLIFLRVCNVIRKVVPNFACVGLPLIAELRKDCLAIFESLNENGLRSVNLPKNVLVPSPVLTLSKNAVDMTPDTDACGFQIGCVLLQQQLDSKTDIIGYRSRSHIGAKL